MKFPKIGFLFHVNFCLLLLFSPRLQAGVTDSWFPLPASNSQFLAKYQEYARMLWAFDYGHGLTYEALWRNTQTGSFDFCFIEGSEDACNGNSAPPGAIIPMVRKILASPPTQVPTEESIAPNFGVDFSWVMDIFSWSHKFHWVAYDVIANEPPERAKAILKFQLEEVYRRYPSLAIPILCKSMMHFMGQLPYSIKFKTNAPTANGLIWAYHYYQLALYDALMIQSEPERQAVLKGIMKKFKWMIVDPVNRVPKMPMAKDVAPKFFKEYPELAALFDNLHILHDVVGDVLATSQWKYTTGESIPGTPKNKKAELRKMTMRMLDNFTEIVDCKKNE